MEVRRFTDPTDWLAVATPLLLTDEPRHNLLFGVADTLIRRPATYPEAHLWVAMDRSTPVGAMLQTPPYNAVVAAPRLPGAVAALAEAAVADADPLPGVSAAVPEAITFADAWAGLGGGTWSRTTAMGVYACAAVMRVEETDGAPRVATIDDLDDLLPLVDAFVLEALPEPDRDRGRLNSMTRARLGDPPDRGGFWVWERDGGIVCLSGYSGRTPTGMRIGPVYTPPEDRGNGYATALVHAQTSWLLSDVVRRCFLYTDLSNDTSNGVYRRIGYEQVCEAAEIRFAPRAATEPASTGRAGRDQPQSGGVGA